MLQHRSSSVAAPELMGDDPREGLRDPCNPGKSVEAGIETHDPFDTVLSHDGQVNCVACGEPAVSEHDLFGSLEHRAIDRQDFIYKAKQSVERRLNRIKAVDGRVPVQKFLKNFRIADHPLPSAYPFLDKNLGFELARRILAHKVHGNVGINQDQSCGPRGIPAQFRRA